MHICLFEDDGFNRLLPLAHLRPVYDLACGIVTLREKINRTFPHAGVTLHAREYLAQVLTRNNPGLPVNTIPRRGDAHRVLFINGRLLAGPDLAKKVKDDGTDCVYTDGETPVAAWLSGEHLDRVTAKLSHSVLKASDFSGLETRSVEFTMIDYPWDLVNHNGEQIEADFKVATQGRPEIQGQVDDGVHLLNPSGIHVAPEARIKPGAVLDAENGPIYVGAGTTVLSNAVVEGPVSIGEKSLIKVGAKIYENSSIGRVCKVGGELEETIIDAYSNKQHDGFIGHAYVGSWVNIGADSNNSDLKNNYGTVKVFINGEPVDSGSMFVGLFMGDHSKSGINLMFNTGTVVGACCNVFGSGLPPKFVPSFSWGGHDGFTTYKIDKAMEVARRVTARRDVPFTREDEVLFQTVFEQTENERRTAGIEPA